MNSVFGIIGITLAVISGLSIIAIIVALIKPKERENNLSSSARVIIPRDNVESIIDLNTCRINLNTCRINLRAQIYKNDSNNLPPNYQNEWREEYDKNQQPPNYQSLPPQYTKEDESRYKKAQEANRPSNSVRIDEGFFSRLRNSKICAVLLIDNDAREERNHNGQNWFQQLFNIKPVQAKTR